LRATTGRDRNGFTLLELMVVLFIIAVTIALVAPQGYKVYDQAKTHLARVEEGGFKKKAVFQAFLLNTDCDAIYDKGKLSLVCQGKTILSRDVSQEFNNFHISNKGFTTETKKE